MAATGGSIPGGAPVDWAQKALLVTGKPGSGKTTLIRAVADTLGARAGGFYTAEIREHGRRAGFEIVTPSGERAILAHVRLDSPFRVSRYGVDLDALERVGVRALREATRSGLIVVIDEIGKMELLSSAFFDAVMEALELAPRVVASIMIARHPLADRIRHDPRVRILGLTEANRSAALGEAREWATR